MEIDSPVEPRPVSLKSETGVQVRDQLHAGSRARPTLLHLLSSAGVGLAPVALGFFYQSLRYRVHVMDHAKPRHKLGSQALCG